jgi:UDP-N-acetyl-D-mannosaminuronate dehydrogenase
MFFVGYSPERINPGDKEHTVEKILKSPWFHGQMTKQIIASLRLVRI